MLQSCFFILPGFESQVNGMNFSNTNPKHKTPSLVAMGSNQVENLFTLDKRNKNGLKGSSISAKTEPIEPQHTK